MRKRISLITPIAKNCFVVVVGNVRRILSYLIYIYLIKLDEWLKSSRDGAYQKNKVCAIE